jgi:hypothetical protein
MAQLALDPALEVRAKAVAERFVGPEDTPANRQLRVDIASTVYALLEAEQKGVRITDNEHTLRANRSPDQENHGFLRVRPVPDDHTVLVLAEPRLRHRGGEIAPPV